MSSKKSKSYKGALRNTANKLELFEKNIGKKIYSNSFSAETMEAFIYFLQHDPKMYAPCTVSGFARKIRSAILRASELKYAVDLGFRDVKLPHEDTVAIAISPAEIRRIFELKKLSKEACAVRDVFVVGLNTGFRLSDLYALNETNFINENVYRRTKKTGATVIIPQHWMVKEILARNEGALPKLPSRQAYNKAVKRICKRAGITDKVLVERTRGVKIVRKLMPKYKLVSSHTARRSLATNMYLAGIPAMRIMLITGHTTESAFFKYIRISKVENATVLSKHPFFMEPNSSPPSG